MTTSGEPPRVLDPEGRPVGLLLKTRRQEHQVSQGELVKAARERGPVDIVTAETQDTPPLESVRIWYAALIPLVGIKSSWQQRSYAERNQWYATGCDRRLHAQLAAEGQRVAWWWGMAKASPPRGAWCYLCAEMIWTYDVSSMMSHAARLAVMTHRAEHVRALMAADTTHATIGENR